MKGGLERCQTRGCRKDCSGVPLLPRVLTTTAPGEDFGSGSSSPSNRESQMNALQVTTSYDGGSVFPCLLVCGRNVGRKEPFLAGMPGGRLGYA